MRLIKWHYFEDETIDFERISFLTGRTAAGKSTIIDALQLVLLGDTSGHFFNKAASNKSARTLKGYLRGDYGNESNNGEENAKRQGKQFTSYIACEFHDTLKHSDFTLGVVFDCYKDDADEHRFFWLEAALPENGFVADNIPMNYTALKNYFAKNYKKGQYEFPDTNTSYREAIKGKFGGLNDRFFRLIKKAVPFAPINNIESFITDSVCDIDKSVDITLMQDNIRYYKQLEYQADEMSSRIANLEEIARQYAEWADEKLRLDIQTYIVERAQRQIALEALAGLQESLRKNNEEIALRSADLVKCGLEMGKLREEKERLTRDKITSDIYRKMDELDREKNQLTEKIGKIKEDLKQITNNMRRYGLVWRECTRHLSALQDPGEADPASLMSSDTMTDWDRLCECGIRAAQYAQVLKDADAGRLAGLGAAGFSELRQDIEQLRETALGLRNTFSHSLHGTENRLTEKRQQVEELEKGNKPYDRKLLELRNEIAASLAKKYGRQVDVHILADLLEIRDVRWGKAVEAYLHTQKFYLIVDPEYFIDALKIYDRLKFDRGFYDWGVVDTGKLAAQAPSRQSGSLAEEIETVNHYARLFVDFTMGRLIKCDRVEDLRNHDRSITDSCMLYQGFVARQLNPDRWQSPYIGKRAIEEQIRLKKQEIASLTIAAQFYSGRLEILKQLAGMGVINSNEANYTLGIIGQAAALPDLEQQLHLVLEQLGALDLTWLSQLDAQIRDLEKTINKLETKESELNRCITIAETINSNIESKEIPNERENADNRLAHIKELFPDDWVEEHGEPRFLKELKARKSAKDIYNNFCSQIARTASQESKKKGELIMLRTAYNEVYRMPHDPALGGNEPYDKELAELRDVGLPAYKERIRHAKEQAQERFREDFLAKLKSNIDTVRRQIDELNAALKESSFGTDRYRFLIAPKESNKKFYDMIMDEMLLKGYNLFSAAFQDKHGDAIEELFRLIVDVDEAPNADSRVEIEQNIARYTDYRTYLDFDLEVKDESGRGGRLSKTLHIKSGGETQTPFYIAMLASFAQLYHISRKGESMNTIRLIIFDEVFNKMDGERIQESIRMLRQFGFQAILAAPPEKVGDIAPLVDRNLCVLRTGTNTCVKCFDGRKSYDEAAR
jgi:energy-coupling factor transporter ATP-binding protein EcfA2